MHNIYAIRDEKCEYYINTIQETPRNEPDVIRSFTEALTNKQSKLGKNPEDYSIYLIATFNDNTGQYKNIIPVKSIIRGSELYVQNTEIKNNGQIATLQNK